MGTQERINARLQLIFDGRKILSDSRAYLSQQRVEDLINAIVINIVNATDDINLIEREWQGEDEELTSAKRVKKNQTNQ